MPPLEGVVLDFISEGGRIVLTKPYQSRRLIVKTDGTPPESLSQISGVTQTLEGPDNTFILQFDSELDAKTASEQLESVAVFSELDIIMSSTV
jgi:hypothetical protein